MSHWYENPFLKWELSVPNYQESVTTNPKATQRLSRQQAKRHLRIRLMCGKKNLKSENPIMEKIHLGHSQVKGKQPNFRAHGDALNPEI